MRRESCGSLGVAGGHGKLNRAVLDDLAGQVGAADIKAAEVGLASQLPDRRRAEKDH